jgi:serine/threonine protein kinase/Tol biopolymer transport system component/Tfp pilus assembly protein PilF
MTPERWQQIKAVLEEALERDPPERESFLDKACAGDSDLRAEVEALLDSHARSGDFIESPAYEVLADSLTQTDLVPGTNIGPYEIIRRLGSGGMGDIYLAEDTRLGRKVALKSLPAHFTKDAERVRRFQLEAKAASALSHPNIITIYEIGQLEHLHYIVFEFIDGQTLRRHMASAPLTIAESLNIASSVAAALLAAHEAGIVHRDIKPENIMMRADGVVKVLDFGLAKLTERKAVVSEASTMFQTEPGLVMGTAPYLSPEQARGLAIDPRTDIWSLGAVLYEMVAGRTPFEGPTNTDVLVAILGREPVPLPRYRPEVPTELEWIIKKALRKDREERYQTAREFLADIKNLAQRLDFEQELERSLDTSDSRRPAYQSQPKSSSQAIDSLANRLDNRPTDNVEAYHAYLKGRFCWNKRNDEDVRTAIEYFKKAIDADPAFALAYVGLADSYLVIGGFGIATIAPKDAYPKAREALERALEIDDTLAEAHASLGYCLANYDWNWIAAKREFNRALELKPDYPVAHHWYAFIFLAAFGRLDEAIAEMQSSLSLDPLSLPVGSNIGLVLYLARRNEEALAHFKRNLELDRSFVYTHWQIGLAYEECGRYDEAIATFRKAMELSRTSTLPRALLARTYALSGKRNEALTLLDELNELSTQHYVSSYRIAAVYAALGDKDRAFKWLDHAYEARDGWLIWLAVDPVVDRLRSDERFTELLRRIGLPTVSGARDSATSLVASTQVGPQNFVGRFAGLAVVSVLVILMVGAGYLLLKLIGARKTAKGPEVVSFQQLTYQSGPEFFPSLSPDGKSAVYASRASGNWDIYFQRIGDANFVNLTKDSVSDDSQPAFSPDGQRIAFRSERNAGGIYVMNANGDSPVRVSDFGYSPSWSPDGAQIFVGTEKIPQPSTRPTKSQLWIIDVKSGQRQQISEGDALQPTCSPHRKRIAYWSRGDRYGQREHIWTIPVTGGEPVAVTDGSSTDFNPVWSPDGKYLYFSSNRGGSSNIWRVLIDEDTGVLTGAPEAVTSIGATSSVLYLSFSLTGQLAYSAQTDIRNLRRISLDPTLGTVGKPVAVTEGSLQFWFPDVSPDGEWLTAYSMGQQRHVYIMRTDGTNQRDLTPDTYRHAWPRWSPDGQRIAFTSRRTGDYELWMMNRDGSNLRQVTQSNGGHYSPWSVDGRMIAYSIHTPKNDCVIINPDKSWSDQKFVYLSPLSDASLSFEGWSWSTDGKKLAGIKHLPNGVHSGIGIYDLEAREYDWLTDFGDWPIWLNDNRHLLFVSQGTIYLFDTASRKYREIFEVTDQDVDIGSPALSRNNRTIYFTYVAAESDIWLMNLAAK